MIFSENETVIYSKLLRNLSLMSGINPGKARVNMCNRQAFIHWLPYDRNDVGQHTEDYYKAMHSMPGQAVQNLIDNLGIDLEDLQFSTRKIGIKVNDFNWVEADENQTLNKVPRYNNFLNKRFRISQSKMWDSKKEFKEIFKSIREGPAQCRCDVTGYAEISYTDTLYGKDLQSYLDALSLSLKDIFLIKRGFYFLNPYAGPFRRETRPSTNNAWNELAEKILSAE